MGAKCLVTSVLLPSPVSIPNMAQLYPIADADACSRVGVDPVDLAQLWASLGIRRVQVRAKSLAAADYLQLLKRCVRALPSGSEIFANDRADLAELAGCFGVHVGQDDLPVEAVKRTFPKLRVGVSTHDWDQLTKALHSDPDYVAFGPVFPTESKQNPEPCVGLTELGRASAAARGAHIPLVAIGGIHAGNVGAIAGQCEFVALIGALTAASPALVTERYMALCAALSPLV